MEQYIRSELLNRFEFQNYGHALEILSEAFPEEWADIQDCLASLKISVSDLTEAGGNETAIPKKFRRPFGKALSARKVQRPLCKRAL